MNPLSFRGQPAQLPDDFFNESQPIVVTRAPCRLDVMSGMADFSGGLCVQYPLEKASWCALQSRKSGNIQLYGVSSHDTLKPHHALSSTELAQLSFDHIRKHFAHNSSTRWLALLLGSLLNLRDGGYISAEQIENSGASLLLLCDVPLRSGLASSASIVAAATLAWQHAFNIIVHPSDLLKIGARVCHCIQEHQPASDLDGSDLSPFASILFGQESQLSQFLPPTKKIPSALPLPDNTVLYAFVCGQRHENARALYDKARCATFMGRRILRDIVPHEMRAHDGELYLANISVDVWRALRNSIPTKMSGRDFLNLYRGHEDSRTDIQPNDEYSIRLAIEHPIYENARTGRFIALLEAAQNNPAARDALLIAAGELMIQSHCSYDHRYALHSPATDLAVELCRKRIPREGILGAKITGNGGGGAVAILADKRKNPEIESLIHEIAAEYQTQTGNLPLLLTSSSTGALHWNHGTAFRTISVNDLLTSNF